MSTPSMIELTGLSKEEALLILTKYPDLSDKHIKHLINCLNTKKSVIPINSIKVGDVIDTRLAHPGLIISIKKDVVICVLITSEPTTNGILLNCKSRFYQGCYITNTIVVNTLEESLTCFRNIYDHNQDIIDIKKKLKEFYKSILTIKNK